MKMTEATTAYDLVLNNGQSFSDTELDKITPTSDAVYQQKRIMRPFIIIVHNLIKPL